MNVQRKFPSLEINEILEEEIKESVINVFAQTFGAKVEAVSSRRGSVVVADVSGVVGMVQEELEGNLIIAFSKESISKILSKVYGHTFDSVNSTVQQGAAELTNMVYGQLKLRLNERGYGLKMALPNVIIGPDHNILQMSDKQSLLIDFKFDDDSNFCLVLALNRIS